MYHTKQHYPTFICLGLVGLNPSFQSTTSISFPFFAQNSSFTYSSNPSNFILSVPPFESQYWIHFSSSNITANVQCVFSRLMGHNIYFRLNTSFPDTLFKTQESSGVHYPSLSDDGVEVVPMPERFPFTLPFAMLMKNKDKKGKEKIWHRAKAGNSCEQLMDKDKVS